MTSAACFHRCSSAELWHFGWKHAWPLEESICTEVNSAHRPTVSNQNQTERGEKNKERGTSHRKAARSGCPAGRGGELGSWCRRSHLPSSEPLRPERSSHLSPPGTRQQDSSATGPQCLSFEEEDVQAACLVKLQNSEGVWITKIFFIFVYSWEVGFLLNSRWNTPKYCPIKPTTCQFFLQTCHMLIKSR